MRQTIELRNADTWAEIEYDVKVKDNGDKVFSASGNIGYYIPEENVREQALEFWVSYFEEDDSACVDMLKRFKDDVIGYIQAGKSLEEACAEVVLDVDGDDHGLDIHAYEDGKALLYESGGQCLDSILEAFPETQAIHDLWVKWHLNDMNAGCIHQDRGEYKCGDICPTCGYSYGSKWTLRELPEDFEEQLEKAVEACQVK